MKVIITGATGMVGKAVLIACLDDPSVNEVLLISRNPIGIAHPKLKECLVATFTDIPHHADTLKGYDACFHCMGVSAIGLSEAAYSEITFGYTKILLDTLIAQNPNMMAIYVSGAGTDSSARGNTMWARVKGKTENYLLNLGFKDAYAFRPGLILPEKGVKSKIAWYNAAYVVLRPFFPLLRKMKNTVGSSDIGKAMLALSHQPDATKIVAPQDIKRLAQRYSSPI